MIGIQLMIVFTGLVTGKLFTVQYVVRSTPGTCALVQVPISQYQGTTVLYLLPGYTIILKTRD